MDLIPPQRWTSIETTDKKLETMERSLIGDSTRDSTGGSSPGEPGSIKIPTLKAWKGSGCSPFLQQSGGCVSGPCERYERYFQRLRWLNRGLDTGRRTVYERRVEPNGAHHVLSIDCRLSRRWER